MLVRWSPQRSDRQLSYAFPEPDVIEATLDGVTDRFDFSGLPNGEAASIESVLDPCPVLSARRVDGELHVTLLRTIGPRPSDPAQLEAWKRLWTDDLEVVIDG